VTGIRPISSAIRTGQLAPFNFWRGYFHSGFSNTANRPDRGLWAIL